MWACSAASVVSNYLRPHGLQPTRLLLSLGFFRQEYWSGLPFPPPGDFPNSGIEPSSPEAPALQADSLSLSHEGSPWEESTYSTHCANLQTPNERSWECWGKRLDVPVTRVPVLIRMLGAHFSRKQRNMLKATEAMINSKVLHSRSWRCIYGALRSLGLGQMPASSVQIRALPQEVPVLGRQK